MKFKLPAGQMSFFDLPLEAEQPQPEVTNPPQESTSVEVSVQEEIPQAVVEEAVEAASEPTASIPAVPEAVAVPEPEPEPEVILVDHPSVTFHKNGKKLLVKPDDVLAADIWREAQLRMKNHRMNQMAYFRRNGGAASLGNAKELKQLWRFVLDGLDKHPYKKVLEACGVRVDVSPSLAGWMAKEQRRMELKMAPYVCYESSNADLTETVQPDMILRARKNACGFEKDKRYMVLDVSLVKNPVEGEETEQTDLINSKVTLSSKPLEGRTLLDAQAPEKQVPFYQLNEIFEDSDKFVVESDIKALYPKRVEQMEARLDELPIGSRLFLHSRQDAPCEALKGDVLCSKEMRMGKTREALAMVELMGSKTVAWAGPSDALVDTKGEFDKAGIFDYYEVERIGDLEVPAKYHIFTYNFLKQSRDPLEKLRRGQKTKTWLRAMGEGQHEAECPHCGQTLERPEKVLDALGRVVQVNWTTMNGYVCRNPECQWVDDDRQKKGAAWKNRTLKKHHGGYIDWERMTHAQCGDHVGRARMCPKCGTVDSAWQPPIYKRIKKNYATSVVDEAHNAKDHTTKTSHAVFSFRGRHHVTLTGTPISNNLLDMFTPLLWTFRGPNLLFPYGYDDKPAYKERFCEDVHIQREGSKGHYKVLPYPKNPVDLWGFLSKLIVRRTRQDPVYLQSLSELNLKVPKEDPQVMSVRMVPQQALLMLNSIEEFKQDFADYCEEVQAKGHAINESLVIGQMSRMKIAATVPAMLNRKLEPGADLIYELGDRDPRGMGGKGIALNSVLPAKIAQGRKIVILSDFVLMRELIAEEFKHLNPVLMQSGSVDVKRKFLDQFRNDPLRQLLIAGPQQICQGIDLSCADVLILIDLMWKAAKQKQALARLMGPTPHERTVEIIILNSLHSIDEHIYNVFYGKIAGAEQALDKRVISRTNREVNWKMFVDQVVEQQEAIANYLREAGSDDGIVVPDFMDSVLLGGVA